MTIIIGIDPGYEDLGIGLIETDPIPTFIYANTFTYPKQEYLPGYEHYEFIKPMAKVKRQAAMRKVDIGERLMRVELSLQNVLAQYKPEEAAIEIPFFVTKNDVANFVNYVVGVLIKNLTAWSIPRNEYSPSTVKLQVGGSGTADKERVREGVVRYFDVPDLESRKSDEVDALAIALTHYEKSKIEVKYG